MGVGDILSLIAVCLSFVGVASSFVFSYKKADRERDQERELNIKNITTIKNKLDGMGDNVAEIKTKVDRIDDKLSKDHETIVEHEEKIKHLEKEVFKYSKED